MFGPGQGRGRTGAENKSCKKEELQKVTRIYMDFFYNGIGEEEEEKEGEEGVKVHEEDKKGDSPSIVVYDSNQKAVAAWVMSSKSVTKGGPTRY